MNWLSNSRIWQPISSFWMLFHHSLKKTGRYYEGWLKAINYLRYSGPWMSSPQIRYILFNNLKRIHWIRWSEGQSRASLMIFADDLRNYWWFAWKHPSYFILKTLASKSVFFEIWIYIYVGWIIKLQKLKHLKTSLYLFWWSLIARMLVLPIGRTSRIANYNKSIVTSKSCWGFVNLPFKVWGFYRTSSIFIFNVFFFFYLILCFGCTTLGLQTIFCKQHIIYLIFSS